MSTSLLLASLAARLRSEREHRGLTLDELSQMTGVSKPHLSRIESGERQPAIATLLTLAKALDVKVGVLLGEDADELLIGIHAPDAPAQSVNGLRVSPASGYRGSRELESLRITVAGDRSDAPFVQHRGEEWLYVISGEALVDHGSGTYRIAAGDCVHFDANQPHRLRAPDGEAQLMLVTTSTYRGFDPTH